jgi:uncharacterized protein (DUF934 family)
MALWSEGGFVEDRYQRVDKLEGAPLEGAALVSWALWKQEKPALTGRFQSVGVEVAAGKDAIDELHELLDRPMIALSYGKFADGRAFSYSRLLRTRLGYVGEIRAVGDVLFDEIGYMVRCGFDTFEVKDAPTLRALQAGKRPGVALLYQPGLAHGETPAAGRPWTRSLTV